MTAATIDVAQLLSLSGRVALVTGARGGIGSAIVATLCAAGATVLASDRPHARAGTDAAWSCDVADPEAIRRLIEQVGTAHGRLDMLVHAAGITRDAVLWKLADEDWAAVLDTNLGSGFHLLKAAVPLLRATDDASVVMIASINGERGKFGQSAYAASKAGLIALARTAARELGAFGIRVNALAPGLIDTPMTLDLPDDVRRRATDETALGRPGRPEDVARSTLFLCSPLSSHVTGQVLRVDGGQLMA